MCRVMQCFDVDDTEHAALDALHSLRTERDNHQIGVHTLRLFRLDARIIDWQPITDVMIGARVSAHARMSRRYPSEASLLKSLRLWVAKTTDELSHAPADHALANAGMLELAPLTARQKTARGKAWDVQRKFQVSEMGRAYLSWLEARDEAYHAELNAAFRDHMATVHETRAWLAGVR